MANGRGGRRKVDTGRDGGRFIALPVSVMENAAYMALSANARSLLLELALQFHGGDNGRLLLSRAHLKKRGFKSSDMIDKGKRELIAGGFIFETVLGHRPNKASWYAVTWFKLDKLPGFDAGAALSFQRSPYNDKPQIQNAGLRPRDGTERRHIAPLCGTESPLPVPQDGAVLVVSGTTPVPPHGHPLESHLRVVRARSRMAMLLRRARLDSSQRPLAYHIDIRSASKASLSDDRVKGDATALASS